MKRDLFIKWAFAFLALAVTLHFDIPQLLKAIPCICAGFKLPTPSQLSKKS